MTESAVVYTADADAGAAAHDLADKARRGLGGNRPDAVIVFASPRYDQKLFLERFHAEVEAEHLVGASSAGEFTREQRGEGLACALALRSDELQFSSSICRGLSADRAAAARQLASGFRGVDSSEHLFRSALVLTDALAGHADDLVEQLTVATSSRYQFFGGGAGDNAQFRRTQVFFRGEAVSDAAVALEILSDKPIGVGVGHGWQPASPPLRVTEASGLTLISLNGVPAVEAFEEHARRTGQQFDSSSPIPFFLQNILGIETAEGHRLRVPLAVHSDGSIGCAAELPRGATAYIMKSDADSAVQAAERATTAALGALGGHKPQVGLFFDCVATRLRLGESFGFELDAVAKSLGTASFAGCNTHGQIARAAGQFSGFHNCTAVVCLLPA